MTGRFRPQGKTLWEANQLINRRHSARARAARHPPWTPRLRGSRGRPPVDQGPSSVPCQSVARAVALAAARALASADLYVLRRRTSILGTTRRAATIYEVAILAVATGGIAPGQGETRGFTREVPAILASF
jgi:hypothetical protein